VWLNNFDENYFQFLTTEQNLGMILIKETETMLWLIPQAVASMTFLDSIQPMRETNIFQTRVS
jgi:hypothetical protein